MEGQGKSYQERATTARQANKVSNRSYWMNYGPPDAAKSGCDQIDRPHIDLPAYPTNGRFKLSLTWLIQIASVNSDDNVVR